MSKRSGVVRASHGGDAVAGVEEPLEHVAGEGTDFHERSLTTVGDDEVILVFPRSFIEGSGDFDRGLAGWKEFYSDPRSYEEIIEESVRRDLGF